MSSQTEWERRAAWSQARSRARREADRRARPVDWVARCVVVGMILAAIAAVAYIFIFGAVLVAPA